MYILKEKPKEFVLQQNNDTAFVNRVKQAYESDAKAGKLVTKNNFYLERCAYDIIAVMDENTDTKPYRINVPVIDLFDPELPVLAQKRYNRVNNLYCLMSIVLLIKTNRRCWHLHQEFMKKKWMEKCIHL